MRFLLPASFLIAFASCSPPAMLPLAERQRGISQQESELAQQSDSALATRIDAILSHGLNRRSLDSGQNAAWQIMHAVIAYGSDLQILTPDQGQVGALDYMLSGGLVNGFELMRGGDLLPATGRPGVKARLEAGSYEGQGHVDQWIAILAMADVPSETAITIGTEKITVEDFARQAQYDTSKNLLNEFSWTLIALTHYFPDEPNWQAAEGHRLSWEDLVEQELAYDIDYSPCGGTHRMAGLVRAIQAKERLNLPDTPIWQEAKDVVADLLEKTKQNRGTDGALSSNYFTSAGSTADLWSELSSSGHLFEFVALAASNDELAEPWITLSANRLCELLEATQDVDLDCGALYHALNGVKIYRDRRFP